MDGPQSDPSATQPRARRVSASPTARVEERAAALRREGRTLFRLGLGEPDAAIPPHVLEATARAITDGRATGYTDTAGSWSLREIIAQRASERLGIAVTPDAVVVTAGAKQAIAEVLAVTCADGDEVLVPVPYWVSFPEQVRLVGARPRFVHPSTGLKVSVEDLAASIGPRTRVLILNSPNNPSGAVYREHEIAAIAALCERHGIVVLSDEVYGAFIHEPAGRSSIASVMGSPGSVIVVDSASKAWAMPGWRIGYAIAEPEVVRAMVAVQSHTTSNASSIAQVALEAALRGDATSVEAYAEEIAARMAWLLRRLEAIPGLAVPDRPEGGFFAWTDLDGVVGRPIGGRLIGDADDLADVAITSAGIVLTPGTGFGSARHIRLSVAAPRAELEEGFDRLEALLASS